MEKAPGGLKLADWVERMVENGGKWWRIVRCLKQVECWHFYTFLIISLSNSWSAALGKSHSWKGTTTASWCHFAADFPMVFQTFSNYGSRTLEQHLLFDTQKLISPGSRHGQWKGQDSGRASRQDCARRFFFVLVTLWTNAVGQMTH